MSDLNVLFITFLRFLTRSPCGLPRKRDAFRRHSLASAKPKTSRRRALYLHRRLLAFQNMFYSLSIQALSHRGNGTALR